MAIKDGKLAWGGLEETIGWPKINIDQYFYGNPRNLLEQYFNLYMAYRIIDYEETFDKFFKLINFLNFDESETEIVIDNYTFKKIESINFSESSDTVGPRSISKQELIKEYRKIL